MKIFFIIAFFFSQLTNAQTVYNIVDERVDTGAIYGDLLLFPDYTFFYTYNDHISSQFMIGYYTFSPNVIELVVNCDSRKGSFEYVDEDELKTQIIAPFCIGYMKDNEAGLFEYIDTIKCEVLDSSKLIIQIHGVDVMYEKHAESESYILLRLSRWIIAAFEINNIHYDPKKDLFYKKVGVSRILSSGDILSIKKKIYGF